MTERSLRGRGRGGRAARISPPDRPAGPGGSTTPQSGPGLGDLVERASDATEHVVELSGGDDQRRTEAQRLTEVARNQSFLQGGFANRRRGIARLGIRPGLDLERTEQTDAARRMRQRV